MCSCPFPELLCSKDFVHFWLRQAQALHAVSEDVLRGRAGHRSLPQQAHQGHLQAFQEKAVFEKCWLWVFLFYQNVCWIAAVQFSSIFFSLSLSVPPPTPPSYIHTHTLSLSHCHSFFNSLIWILFCGLFLDWHEKSGQYVGMDVFVCLVNFVLYFCFVFKSHFHTCW